MLLGAHVDSWHSATGATDNADELKRAAVVLASFAYQAAMRTERFPRALVTP